MRQMLIGIDVGGTYTDGVLFKQGAIIATVKKPTDDMNLKSTLLEVLDELLPSAEGQKIERIVFSTTLVTNLLATGQGERTALIMLPGHGLPHDAYDICPDIFFARGTVDFRGNVIEKLDQKEIDDILARIAAAGIKRVAVAAKFANRNDILEREIQSKLAASYPDISVSISSEISNKLNFPRRAATTYFTAMTVKEWMQFAAEIDQAITERGLDSELHILKADGGTFSLDTSSRRPCETVFSGPAASTMGGLALSQPHLNSVVLDIGGTTSDIALIIDGAPLYASKGARLGKQYTHINAFAVNSVALGGDSCLDYDGEIKVQNFRRGAAACFGGDYPTVTDAFNCKMDLGIGNAGQSAEKLQQLASKAGMKSSELCRQVVNIVIERLVSSIEAMFREWENEPAYKVWEVVNRRKFKLDQIIGIGAAATAIVPQVAARMEVDSFLHDYSPVANALGAAVVRPTLAVELHVDTPNNFFSVGPGGIRGSLNDRGGMQLGEAKNMARQYLLDMCREQGMESYASESSFYMEEQFNIISGWSRSGKIFDVGIQIAPGFISEYKGVSS